MNFSFFRIFFVFLQLEFQVLLNRVPCTVIYRWKGLLIKRRREREAVLGMRWNRVPLLWHVWQSSSSRHDVLHYHWCHLFIIAIVIIVTEFEREKAVSRLLRFILLSDNFLLFTFAFFSFSLFRFFAISHFHFFLFLSFSPWHPLLSMNVTRCTSHSQSSYSHTHHTVTLITQSHSSHSHTHHTVTLSRHVWHPLPLNNHHLL